MIILWSQVNKIHVLVFVVVLMILCNRYYVFILKSEHITPVVKNPNRESTPLKYILQWSLPDREPFAFWGTGQDGFLKRKCKVTTCYVTHDRSLLKDITDYDAIAFHGPEIVHYNSGPKQRSIHQKYVYVSMESSHYYPICDMRYDIFFNWTLTYRLDSNVPYGYIVIRNIEGDIIGPKKTMNWINIDSMKPINEEVKERLNTKTKAAAWFVSNCRSKSGREKYVKQLQNELKRFNLEIDIFGYCGSKQCSLYTKDECFNMIEKDYYFYLALENSFAEDYVTEKLLTSLRNYAVPVVFGGANYTRFMPDGIYLDAGQMAPAALAKEMNDIMHDKERYYSFFRWRNHYSYHAPEEAPETDGLCRLCEMLHDEATMGNTTVYSHIRDWWNKPGYDSACRYTAITVQLLTILIMTVLIFVFMLYHYRYRANQLQYK